MFNDVAIILINKFGIEGEVTPPSTLGLSLEVGFIDHVDDVILCKWLACDHNIHIHGIRYIMDIDGITTCGQADIIT